MKHSANKFNPSSEAFVTFWVSIGLLTSSTHAPTKFGLFLESFRVYFVENALLLVFKSSQKAANWRGDGASRNLTVVIGHPCLVTRSITPKTCAILSDHRKFSQSGFAPPRVVGPCNPENNWIC